DMAKVPSVYDDLNIPVCRRQALQNFGGPVTRRVVDENVFVTVMAETQHYGAHSFIEFADIAFFIEARIYDAERLHSVSSLLGTACQLIAAPDGAGTGTGLSATLWLRLKLSCEASSQPRASSMSL